MAENVQGPYGPEVLLVIESCAFQDLEIASKHNITVTRSLTEWDERVDNEIT
jgi:hypothetical protein